jgi:histidine phosphotransferase ChpT
VGVSLDLRVVELLCSRLCHDLVGPVGAVNNGVELVEEMGAADAGDAFALVADSGRLAAARLKLFRLAYGAAGSEPGVSFETAQTALAAWFQRSKLKIDWQNPSWPDAPAGTAKVLLNAVLLAEESLPQGGTLVISGVGPLLRLAGSGKNAGLKPESREALAGAVAVDALSPRTVQGYITGRFAEHFGFRVTPEAASPDQVGFRIER